MFGRAAEELRRFDFPLLLGVAVLFALGLAAIYSVSLSHEPPDFGDFHKQIIFGAVGLALALFFGLTKFSAWRVYSRVIFAVVFAALVLVLFFGTTAHGTRGWFSLFGLNVQPVELAKLALIISLAKFFSHRLQRFQTAKHIIVSAVICLLLVVPVLLQPDFGSALVLVGTWFIMLLLTGIDRRVILAILLGLILLSGLAWSFVLQDYQQERIMVFLRPETDPLGGGYNVSQSLIAIGSGRFFGRGLGFGSQSQLRFIPEAQTDFIFAVIAEELGFLGVALVIACFVLIFYRLLRIARRAGDDFGQLVVFGVMAVLFVHVIVNVGMNLGLLPVMGISLPFLSYGGSFILTVMAMIGLTQGVGRGGRNALG